MDHLDSIRCFLRVAEAQSFSAAARDLGVAQPTVSKAVAGLEQRLGVQLLRRTTRSLGLTEEGTAYYAACARLLPELEEAEAALGRDELEPRGSLVVSSARDFGQRFVAPVVIRFLERHAAVHVDLVLEDRRVDLVAERVDVAVRLGPLEDSSLRGRRLGRFERVTVASPDYLARQGTPESPGSLAEHECILLTTLIDPGRWAYLRPDSGRMHAVRVRGRFRVRSNYAVREAARAGLGIAQAPFWVVGDDLADGSLRELIPEHRVPAMDVTALHAPAPLVPARIPRFLDALQSAFADHAGTLHR